MRKNREQTEMFNMSEKNIFSPGEFKTALQIVSPAYGQQVYGIREAKKYRLSYSLLSGRFDACAQTACLHQGQLHWQGDTARTGFTTHIG
jgi:hypothetical protein